MIEQIDIAMAYPFALMRALKTPSLTIAKQATDHGTHDGAVGDAGEQRPKRGHIELIHIDVTPSKRFVNGQNKECLTSEKPQAVRQCSRDNKRRKI